MECGKSFIKSLRRSLEVKCPKCKSVDIELENVNVSGEIIKEALHPYKDFNQQDQEKQYDLNLGAFIDKYQQMMKFMKKYKEVPDKNKRTWAALIRKKVGQGRFNGLIGDWAQVTQYLKSFDKFRNKKDDYAWDIKGESTKRDYKAEYKKYGSSTKAKKYRAELNQYNRKKGTYGNNDGKDASHKGGKIAGFEKESTNRGRREKSRLKKEFVSVNEAVEPQGNMAKIAKIVKRKQATKLSGVMIDMQSASLLMKLWDAVSDKDKEKMNKLNAKVLTTIIKKLWSRVNLKLPI
jgi:flagellar hook-basal body complex protein FliE